MKQLFYISFLLFTAACSTVKKTVTTDRKTVETSHTAKQETVVKERVVRDTVIVIKERQVKGVVDSVQLATDSFYSERTDKGLKAWVRKTPAGMEYGCNVDSFIIVVNTLIRERDSVTALYRYEHFRDAVFKTDNSIVKERRTFGGWLMNNVYWIVPLALLIGWLLKKYLKI